MEYPCSQVAELENGRGPLLRGGVRLCRGLAEAAPCHQSDHLLLGQLADGLGGHEVAVPKHCYPVSQAEHFFQMVRNVKHPDVAADKVPDQVEQPLTALSVEGCGRLVQDDQLRLAVKDLGYRYLLTLRRRQLGDRHLGVDVEPEAPQQVPGELVDLATVDDQPFPRRQLPEHDVLGHRQPGQELWALVYHGYAQVISMLSGCTW